MELVTEFAGLVGLLGYAVPGDTPELRDRDIDREYDLFEYPPLPYRDMAALAQHHGIPTHLLDWTWKPLVAAYFAAYEVAKGLHGRAVTSSDSDERFAIWALRRLFVVEGCRELSPGPVIVTAPPSSNPNLHAQGGLFSLIRFRRYRPLPNGVDDVPLLDEMLRAMPATTNSGVSPPMLYKLTVPHKEAPRLLRLLDLSGVNAATVFPGLKSVVDSMRERQYWGSGQ